MISSNFSPFRVKNKITPDRAGGPPAGLENSQAQLPAHRPGKLPAQSSAGLENSSEINKISKKFSKFSLAKIYLGSVDPDTPPREGDSFSVQPRTPKNSHLYYPSQIN